MKKNIDQIEQILLSKDPAEWSEEERSILVGEFGNLEEASNYASLLKRIRGAMKADEVALEPNPSIHKVLRAKVEERKAEAHNSKEKNRSWLSVFNVRIPLYQALLVTTCIVFVAIYFNGNEGVIGDSNDTKIVEGDVSIGRTALEDSLLVQACILPVS